jgi:hypothetical membrane protein
MKSMTRQLLALCGMIGPILYAIMVVVLGSLWPGYDHVTQSMSELGAVGAPHAIYMNTMGFPLLGALLIAFSLGLYRNVRKGKSTKIGCALIATSGFALIMTGIFPCDASCIDITNTGTTHSIFATISALVMMVAPLVLLPALGNDIRWHNYTYFSLIVGLIVCVLSAVYGLYLVRVDEGIMQRLSMGMALFWVEIMAMKLFTLSPSGNSISLE